MSEDSSSYFLGMLMLISEICTLTHTRMGLDSVIFPSKGPMRGQYGFFIAKYSNVYGHFLL